MKNKRKLPESEQVRDGLSLFVYARIYTSDTVVRVLSTDRDIKISESHKNTFF